MIVKIKVFLTKYFSIGFKLNSMVLHLKICLTKKEEFMNHMRIYKSLSILNMSFKFKLVTFQFD